ncbi:glycoside hydrolase family 88 protein [Bacillus sp. SL00103]
MTLLTEKGSPLEHAEKLTCNNYESAYTNAFPAGRWHYHQGVFLCGVMKLYESTGERDVFQLCEKLCRFAH